MGIPVPAGPSGLSHIAFRPVKARAQGVERIVYYLERADGAIKIGTTGRYSARRADLIRQHGRLSLIAWEPGGFAREHQRHLAFDYARISRPAEWFDPAPELIDHALDLCMTLHQRGLA